MRKNREDMCSIALFAVFLALFNAGICYAMWNLCLDYGPVWVIPYISGWGIALWIASLFFFYFSLRMPFRRKFPDAAVWKVTELCSPEINTRADYEFKHYKNVLRLQNFGYVLVFDWAMFPVPILKGPLVVIGALITIIIYFLIFGWVSWKQESRLQKIDKNTAFACRANILSRIWSPENKIYRKFMYRMNKGTICLCTLAGLLRRMDHLQEADCILSLAEENAIRGSKQEQRAYLCESFFLNKLGIRHADNCKVLLKIHELTPTYASLTKSDKQVFHADIGKIMSGIILFESDGDWENVNVLCHKLIDSALPEWKKFDAWVACYCADKALHREEEAAELLAKIREYSDMYAEKYVIRQANDTDTGPDQ